MQNPYTVRRQPFSRLESNKDPHFHLGVVFCQFTKAFQMIVADALRGFALDRALHVIHNKIHFGSRAETPIRECSEKAGVGIVAIQFVKTQFSKAFP